MGLPRAATTFSPCRPGISVFSEAVFYADATAPLTGRTWKYSFDSDVRRHCPVRTKVTAHQVHAAIFHNYNQSTSFKCIQAALFDSILPDELLHTALYNVNVSTLKANFNYKCLSCPVQTFLLETSYILP